MGKPFSEMTETERRVNRALLRAGLPADWREATGIQTMNYDNAGLRHAMDAAERRAIQHSEQYSEAQRETAPYLRGMALDGIATSGDLYKLALARLGVDTKQLPTAACRGMFRHMTRGPSAKKLAQDAAANDAFAAKFPNAARIKKG